jgi:hypothetical protein
MNSNNWKLKMKPVSKTFFKGLFAIIPLILTCYLLLRLADTAELVLGISSSFSSLTVGT